MTLMQVCPLIQQRGGPIELGRRAVFDAVLPILLFLTGLLPLDGPSRILLPPHHPSRCAKYSRAI
jgi:hypothetical protein